MYIPEDNLLFRKLGLTRSIAVELSMTSSQFREMFKSKVDHATNLFELFSIREKEYGGSIKAKTFEILHGGSEIAGASGSYSENEGKLKIELIVYGHMIHVFLFLFGSYLIGLIAIYNSDSSEKLSSLIISAISFLIFPAWILFGFRKKVKSAFIDFERAFLKPIM